MRVIKQEAHIVKEWPKLNLYERCEFAGRISHASEDRIKEGSAEKFVRHMVELGHESVFEFARIFYSPIHMPCNIREIRESLKEGIGSWYYPVARALIHEYPAFFSDIEDEITPSENISIKLGDDWIPVLITTNRAISHQLVRYRKDVVYLQASQRYIKQQEGVDFIDPHVYFKDDDHACTTWEVAMEGAEQDYMWFLSRGYPAQAARLVLPNSAATKLIMYASPKTWRRVFEQRISDKADPMIRELLEPLKEEFIKEDLL